MSRSMTSTHQVIDALNTIQPLVTNIRFLAELAPLLDETDDKGTKAIHALEMIAAFVKELDAVIEVFYGLLPRDISPVDSQDT